MTLRQSFFASLIFLMAACNASSDEKSGQDQENDESQKSFVQGVSLRGDQLTTEVDSAAQRDQIDKIRTANKEYEASQTVENLVWKGRQEAYLGRYDLAIETFTKATQDFPEAYEPYRHRGHRYITIRLFDQAVADFNKAAELMNGDPIKIEKDGMPNKQNIPLSNIQFNVWYHLGLAHYLQGDWEEALQAYKKCLEVSDNTDLQVATMDWYYMTLVKLGREAEAKKLIAPVTSEMEIIENESYRKRILMYKGELRPADLVAGSSDGDERLNYVTQGYGVGNYYLAQGDTAQAKEVFQKVIDTGYWAAFGYIASEMELAKLENE